MSGKTIRVGALARVEGEGGIVVRVRGSKVAEAKLNIFEPPRLFEAFLRGRHFSEVPDIVARICGICPVAHQVTACEALENAFGVTVDAPLLDLRRLLFCGEWIESHVLHVGFLHGPDYLGYDDALRMAATHPEILRIALRLKKTGNRIVQVIGGREVHPVNLRVGGFYRAPSRAALRPLIDELEWARAAAVELVRWTATLPVPAFEREYELACLHDSAAYAITGGRVVTNFGVDISAAEFEETFLERQVPHSSALHSIRNGRGAYHCGPLARFHHNHTQLTEACRAEAAAAGLGPDTANPFRSIVIRGIEVLYAVEEALRIVKGCEFPARAAVDVNPRAAVGSACAEAPRGLLFHKYRVSADGLIEEARIVPPTAQSQRVMEEDLRDYAEQNLDLPREELTRRCEQVIRNYDPCISCAAHSLTLDIVNL